MLTGSVSANLTRLGHDARRIRSVLDGISMTSPFGSSVTLIVGSVLPVPGVAAFMRPDLDWVVSASDSIVLRAWRDAYYAHYREEVAA